MSDQWGTREQPSNRDPGGLCAEHIYLLLAVFSIAAAIVLYIADAQWDGFEVNRGAYAILVAFFVAGYCGWLSRSAQRRLRAGQAVVCDRLAEIAAEIEELRTELARQRESPLPPIPHQRAGQPYLSAAAGQQGETVPLASTVPAETMAVLRRINFRLREGADAGE